MLRFLVVWRHPLGTNLGNFSFSDQIKVATLFSRMQPATRWTLKNSRRAFKDTKMTLKDTILALKDTHYFDTKGYYFDTILH